MEPGWELPQLSKFMRNVVADISIFSNLNFLFQVVDVLIVVVGIGCWLDQDPLKRRHRSSRNTLGPSAQLRLHSHRHPPADS